MDGTETCRLEDEIAVALDGREGLRWAGIFLDIALDAGYKPQDVRQAQRDLRKAQRAIDASIARLHADRGALPRGRRNE